MSCSHPRCRDDREERGGSPIPVLVNAGEEQVDGARPVCPPDRLFRFAVNMRLTQRADAVARRPFVKTPAVRSGRRGLPDYWKCRASEQASRAASALSVVAFAQ